MDIEIRHGPAFAVARATLGPGETLLAESGAMMATSAGTEVTSSTEGGVLKGLRRSVLGGDSLFVSRFTAPAAGGWVDVAAGLPGDLAVVDLDGTVDLTRGSWLANTPGVDLDTRWGGMKNLLGGEGGFLVRATGTGAVVVASYGALDRLDLGPEERVVIDSGHVVAFSTGATYETRSVSAGLVESLRSGERLVFEFAGPGQVWTQSRSPRELVGWLGRALPSKRK